MKKKFFTILLAGTLVSALSTAAFAGVPDIKMFYNGKEVVSDSGFLNRNGRILAPVRAVAEAMGARVTWDKESRQVHITGNDQSVQIANLERALAADTGLKAVSSWAEGVRTRNGAWQYAVMTTDMKKTYYEEFVSSGWVTGTSSPWVKNFDIRELGNTDESTYRYAVTFTWTDSTNSTSEATQYLTVKNLDGTWLVDSIDYLAVRGKITRVDTANAKDVESIFVEGSYKEATYDQATAIIGAETRIYRANTGMDLKGGDLKQGMEVEVIFGPDPMIMIYPPQAVAKEIRIFK